MINSMTHVHLRPNVSVEPLYNDWYVNLPMIAPHTNAMLIKNSHVKILKSYILSPDMHIAASADPKMRGGPFLSLGKDHLAEAKSLLYRTLVEQKHLIEFAEGIEQLDKILHSEAKGFSLEPLYDKVPDPLKGYVELTYDLNNQPSIRFLEGLLYRSSYYDKDQQSVSLSLINNDYRPFVLSTPRLDDESQVRIRKPFSSEDYDELFQLKHRSRPFGEIAERFQISDANSAKFSLLFSEKEAPSCGSRYTEAGVRVRYFGHACLLLEDRDCSVLIDPLISYRYDWATSRYSFEDLPDSIDYVLITHAHLDHLVLEILLQLRHKIKNIVFPKSSRGSLAEPSLKLLLKNLGFLCNLIELDDLEEIELDNGSITSIPFFGEHHDLNIPGKTAYHLSMGGRSFVVAADSANLEPKLYDRIHDVIGPVDTLFLGMECDGAPLTWFYGHLLTHGIDRAMAYSRKGSGSDESRATALTNSLQCKQAFVYAMGLEQWFGHILSLNYNESSKQMTESSRFVTQCGENGVESERLYAKKELVYG